MKFRITETKDEQMLEFSEKEWELADAKHFGKKGRWKEEHVYINAIEGEEIVGILHYLLKAGVMEIVTLIVSHSLRKQGIGKRLMQEVERIARDNKAHKIYLLTGKDWDSNEFYKKLGFTQTGELKNHFLKRDWVEFSKFI